MPRRSAAAVAETRESVARAAVERASVEGLEGLTIGALADEVAMRKSSLFSLFGSKEELQLTALRAAADDFASQVWAPVASEPAGLPRLLALCESWLAYHERESLPGGCFLTTASVEFDARPGPLRDETARIMRRWHRVLAIEAAAAIDAGELPRDLDPADVAFELNALAAAASYGFHLQGNREAFERARRSMRRVLGA
jgi:AcrR family transcriptional regulator